MTYESERMTRKTRIDPMLRDGGWVIEPYDPAIPNGQYGNHAIEEFPTDNGTADYALVVGGQLIGVIEAKKLSLGPAGVLSQAERYSKGLSDTGQNWRGFRAPFLYSTNGEVIYFHDVRDPLAISRRIAKFQTPSALRELLSRDIEAGSQWLKQNPPQNEKLRPYQKAANIAVENAITAHKRQMLVAMATGTGKTFTTVNQCYRLLKSGAAKRVLFLVDRRALAAQAVRAFAAFEPEPNLKFDRIYEVYSNRFQSGDFGDDEQFDPKVMPNAYLTNPQSNHVFVYVCTIQRMAVSILGRQAAFGQEGDEIDDDAGQLDIPIHAFDVIIADECHRGYTSQEQSTWRSVLDHFDAIRIGLTATPAKHTAAYFKDIVFEYRYEDAVRDGHLVDWDLVKIKSDVRIKGAFLAEGEQIEIVNTVDGSKQLAQLEDERQFDSSEIERRITSPDSNRKILLELKKYTDEHEQRYGRFPKTLIFAVNDLPHASHADELVEIAREVFNQGESFVRKITGRVDRPLQAIREFRNRPNPAIVVTVDLLTTGVDVPDIEFIVFLRIVKSRILFTQMLGRGTRKGFLYPDKSHFTVFDCFDGTLIEYFKNSTDMTEQDPASPSRTFAEIIDDIWQNRDRDYNVGVLVKRLQRVDKQLTGEDREFFQANGIPGGNLADFAANLRGRLRAEFLPTMEILRKPEFLRLLAETRTGRQPFLRAIEYTDTVSSEYLVRDGSGQEYKPEDYLAVFARFVRENADKIDAMRILLERPADWSATALNELKEKLRTAPERFTVEVLEKAHKLQYRKSLIDLISMVKHAAKDESPLLTAEERVDRAMRQIVGTRQFTPQQSKWLELIRQHLVVNLSIDQDDFDVVPIFEQAGGWGKANRDFNGDLNSLLGKLNAAVAA